MVFKRISQQFETAYSFNMSFCQT